MALTTPTPPFSRFVDGIQNLLFHTHLEYHALAESISYHNPAVTCPLTSKRRLHVSTVSPAHGAGFEKQDFLTAAVKYSCGRECSSARVQRSQASGWVSRRCHSGGESWVPRATFSRADVLGGRRDCVLQGRATKVNEPPVWFWGWK